MPEVKWIESFMDILLYLVPKSVKSVLDVGCGRGIAGALVRIYREPQKLVGVDAFEPSLDFCRMLRIYDTVIRHDLRNRPYPFEKDEFDVAIALEVIEHLPKEDGYTLLDELERIAKRVIVSTPSVFFEQPTYDGNPFQRHLSRWSLKEFRQRGYSVFGVGNLLIFGRDFPYISYALSRLTLPFPMVSSHLLAIKDKPRGKLSGGL